MEEWLYIWKSIRTEHRSKEKRVQASQLMHKKQKFYSYSQCLKIFFIPCECSPKDDLRGDFNNKVEKMMGSLGTTQPLWRPLATPAITQWAPNQSSLPPYWQGWSYTWAATYQG